MVEAVEAERKGTNEPTKQQYIDLLEDFDPAKFKAGFKDTVIDELADTVICCLDYIGYELGNSSDKDEYIKFREFTFERAADIKMAWKSQGADLPSFAYNCIYYSCKNSGSGSTERMIIDIQHYAQAHSLPLSEAIDAKLLYNQSRPYRHGKKNTRLC